MKSSPSDPPADIRAPLEAARTRLGRLGSAVLFFPSIGSTNDRAATAGGEGAVVIAEEQTAGRGRRGHTWFSPSGSGLYVSVVVTPSSARTDPLRATMLLTMAAGVALAEGIHASTGVSIDLKWPNDLYASGRKVGGILAEGLDGRVVLGYGINLRDAAYPPELVARATSLESELGSPIERGAVLVETLAALARRYDDLLDGRFDAILDAWRQRAPAARGARVMWTTPAGRLAGVTDGIDADGALLVRVGDGVERIVAGEVTWL